ncbi:MAG: SAM-dependent methyltransferase [Chloroflexi bacterium]|nr:SAM-dependent methyltransferase [Chloroflexota bacterium]
MRPLTRPGGDASKENCLCRPALKELVRRRIRERGRITFAEYMALALYAPGLGYYTAPGRRIGKEGDYFTSPNVSPLFGAALARQLTQMWELLGRPVGFAVVECGAGTGLLAGDILKTLREALPELFAGLRYLIVEVSRPLAAVQRRRLGTLSLPRSKVQWFFDMAHLIREPLPLVGCVLSNEFVDALPVHRVRMVRGHLREIYVTLKDGRFVEVEGPVSASGLVEYFPALGVELVQGQEAEVNLAALRWLEQVGETLDRGFVVTIDYGYEAPELYDPRHLGGTLVGYRGHRLCTNPYEAVGRQDLTAHVDFTALVKHGEKAGLATTGITSQMMFLLSLGVLSEIDELPDGLEARRERLAARHLIMPGGMGEVFRVLIQHKGVANPQLQGLASPWKA